MPIKRSIEELDELQTLSEDDRKIVIQEYKKGYHFLLFYGQIIAFILMLLLCGGLESIIKNWTWVQRILIYIGLGYAISILAKIIEVNLISKRVLRDLIKDRLRHR